MASTLKPACLALLTLAGGAASAHHPVYIQNPTERPWDVVCTNRFFPLRVTTQQKDGKPLAKDYPLSDFEVIKEITKRGRVYGDTSARIQEDHQFYRQQFNFRFVIPANSTACIETIREDARGLAEFRLVDYLERETATDFQENGARFQGPRGPLRYYVQRDLKLYGPGTPYATEAEAEGVKVSIQYSSEAPRGIMTQKAETPNLITFAADSWGQHATRAFQGWRTWREQHNFWEDQEWLETRAVLESQVESKAENKGENKGESKVETKAQ